MMKRLHQTSRSVWWTAVSSSRDLRQIVRRVPCDQWPMYTSCR